jgi:nitrogen fixation protein NifX
MPAAAFARKLTLIDPLMEDAFMQTALPVAFATSDQKHIDQHFGSTAGFAIYLVTEEECRLKEAVAFDAARQDGNEDKLEVRIAALKDCAAVYCQAVGGSAIARLKQAGVQPVKVAPGLEIKAQLAALRKELRDGPAYWIVQALKGEKDAGRFDEMDGEGWSE